MVGQACLGWAQASLAVGHLIRVGQPCDNWRTRSRLIAGAGINLDELALFDERVALALRRRFHFSHLVTLVAELPLKPGSCR